jgi:hypothetical protein
MGANAQTSVPTFTAGQVLTAAQMNNSARTGVPVFADASARDAGFGGTGEKTLAEGQLAYLEDLNVVQYYDGSSWATLGPTTSGVIQVKSTTKTDTFTTTSASYVDVTGLSVSITPTSASNKVLVLVNMTTSNDPAQTGSATQLVRDSTAIAIGDAAGSRIQASTSTSPSKTTVQTMESISYLDSPNTTSATTYKVQTLSLSSGQTQAVNRSVDDTNSSGRTRTVSTITVMEVTP